MAFDTRLAGTMLSRRANVLTAKIATLIHILMDAQDWVCLGLRISVSLPVSDDFKLSLTMQDTA